MFLSRPSRSRPVPGALGSKLGLWKLVCCKRGMCLEVSIVTIIWYLVKPVNPVFFSVPGPPSNVTLVSESQHSIVVYITQPLPLMRNGIIVGYTVFYRETNLLPDAGYLSVNTTASSVTLANLTVFTEYSVKVAAFTGAGMGHESEVKTVVTQEGGSLLYSLL